MVGLAGAEQPERHGEAVSRFLFVVPPLRGHIAPAVAVAEELRARGDRVAWSGDYEVLRAVLPAGRHEIHPATTPQLISRPANARGFAALRHLWEEVLIPLADTMRVDVERAMHAFAPDVVVADQQAFAGALAAQRLGVLWATSATTSAELADPLGAMSGIARWRAELLADLMRRHGLPGYAPDPRFSPRLVLAFTTEELAGPSVVEVPVAFVGPALGSDADHSGALPPLDPDRPLVYVALGTVNDDAGARFLRACAAAVGRRPLLQAVVADPAAAIATAPRNVTVLPYVPQLAVLGVARLVVCHGGHNTVCESLSAGVPLVVAPIRDDQPIVAEQVVRSGAGVRLRFDRADADQIGAAIDTVLTDPAYRRHAERIRASFAAAGGARAAADRLHGLAAAVRT